jgi:flagellar biogenesis protein FliO
MMVLGVLLSASILYAKPEADDQQDAATQPETSATTSAPAPASQPLLIIKDDSKGAPVPASSEATTPLFAKETAKPAAKPAGNALSWQIVKTMLNLVLVLAIAYLVILGAQKYYQGRLPGIPAALLGGNRPRRVMRIVESAPLGPARQVHLLSVGSRTFLLASSGQQVSLLTEVTGDTAVEEAVESQQAPPPSPLAALQRQGATPETKADAREGVNPQAAELIDQFARVLASKMAPSRENS